MKQEVGSVAKRRAAPLPKDPGWPGNTAAPSPSWAAGVGGRGWGGRGWDLCQRVSQELDQCYSAMGSLFCCGFRQTLFSNHMMRYADLYTATCLNFLYHPLSSLYRVAPELVGPCRTPPPRHP